MRSLKLFAAAAVFAAVSLAQGQVPPVTISGSCPIFVPLGSSVSQTLTASGGFTQLGYTWSMQGPSWLSVNPTSGSTTILSGTPPSAGNFPVAVLVQNQAGSATFICSVQVLAPPSINGACPANVVPFGGSYSASFTATGGSGQQGYFWNLDGPPWLTLSSSSGATVSVTGTAPPGSPPVSYTLSLNAFSTAGPATRVCTVQTTTPLTPTFACPGPATADLLFQHALTATGGAPPYTFSIASGSLPAGLTLNAASGTIAGTPLQPGSSSVIFSVRDSGSGSSQQVSNVPCTLTVTPPEAPPLAITSQCPVPAPIGSPYNHVFTSTRGAAGLRWTVAIGRLPEGLLLRDNAIRGAAAGPAGSTPFTIQVASDDGQIATQACSLQVVPPRPEITSACPPDGILNTAYAPFMLTTRGAAEPPVFTVVDGSLPAGLTLNNGVITGTPTGSAGVSTFSIRAAFGTASTATLGPCSLRIVTGPPRIGGTCPTSAQVGVPLSIAAPPSGGTPPYQFAFTGSPWLSFANGAVSGTPPSAGTGTFTLILSDSANQQSQPFTCSFPVTQSLNIEGQCPATVQAGNSISTAFSATGGNGEYIWNITAQPWLTLSATTGATIAVNGTPPAAGTFPFSVTLRDTLGTPARTLSCSLAVAAPQLRITPSANCPASPLALLSPVSFTVAANGGAAPYRWSISGPSWLRLSTSTGAETTASGTVASAPGNYSFTIALDDDARSERASITCPFTVAPLPQPSITLVGPLSGSSGRDQTVAATLPQSLPGGLRGRLTLDFVGDGGLPNDPAIQFSNGTRTLEFTPPTAPQPLFKLGTVAGVITITPTFAADNIDVTPSGTAAYSIRIDRAAAVITAVDCVRTSGTSFTVVVDGYTNTREVATATFRFQAAASANLGTAELSVPVGPQYNAWFSSASGLGAGGVFRATHIFNTQGSASDVGSVSVQLTNSISASAPVSAVCRAQ